LWDLILIVIVTILDKNKIITNRLNDFFAYLDPYPNDLMHLQQLKEICPHSSIDTGIFVGEFKGLDKEGFLKHIEDIEEFKLKDYVQVLFKPDDQMSYSLYVIKNNKFVKVYRGEMY
jgi:hypothetical protein